MIMVHQSRSDSTFSRLANKPFWSIDSLSFSPRSFLCKSQMSVKAFDIATRTAIVSLTRLIAKESIHAYIRCSGLPITIHIQAT